MASSTTRGGEDEAKQMAAELSKTLKEGERLLAPTRRPDGTLRKPIRIRAGYVPQDEVAIYKSKGALWKKEMESLEDVPPGYDPVMEAKPKSKAAKRNERKKEKRQQYNFKRILEECIQIQPIDDQGRPIQPTQEEIMDMWIKTVGGVHKGRVYGLGSEFSLGRRTSGLSASYSSSYFSVDLDEFEQLNWKVAEMTELYLQERFVSEEEAKRREEEAKRREEKDKLREDEMRRKDDALRLINSDVKSLKSQINSLLASGAFPVPRSPAYDDI